MLEWTIKNHDIYYNLDNNLSVQYKRALHKLLKIFYEIKKSDLCF